MSRIRAAVTTALAITFGLLTLIGLLAGGDAGIFSIFTNLVLQLVAITAAVTVLIGILNLLSVHIRRIFRRQGGWFYSIILVLSALAVIIITLLERAGTLTSSPALSVVLLETVQVAVESALAGLVLFALVYGAYRLMRRRVTLWGLIFTIILLVLLVGAVPQFSGLTTVRNWILAVPVSAGARGILLGIALAAVVTGVRILIGQDRSYRD